MLSAASSPNEFLVAALILALALTANFFYAIQRLDVHANGPRRRVASWRRILAFTGAAMLPALSAGAVLLLASRPWSHASFFAGACAACGLISHQLMDAMLRPRKI